MNDHTLRVLEFAEIRTMLKARMACSLGAEVADALQPTADFLSISEGHKETSEARGIIAEEGSMPLGGIHDIRPSVTKAAMDGILEPSELLNSGGTLFSARRLRNFLLKRTDKSPRLCEIASNIGEYPKIEKAITESINEHAEIKDTASPELAAVRHKLKTTHARLIDKLQSIIHSAEFRTMIQDPVVTQRGDRYCIPVKAEHRPHFPGIVHDSSASGATVFIEPASVVDRGNELKELAIREEREVEKILRRLSGMLKSSADGIQATLTAVGHLDFTHAKGRLSFDMDASEPVLNREGRIDMVDARHPLLTGEVVPIDVRLGKGFDALLITGPNTGGKTVTLKTIGLLSLMAQSGLHVPVREGSELAVFEQVFADIGDEQSIQQSLSTFSSHMTNIVGILENMGKNSLVLLDEIGAGTDPAEGAALAKAILDFLVERGAKTVATTHYGELKDFAYVREGVENASVEFDVRTLKPTYRLMIGVPGSSNAFAIASRLGMPLDVVMSARRMVTGTDESGEIIRKIEETHRAAAEREQLAQRTSRDVDALKTRYQSQVEEMEALRRELRSRVTEEVDRRVRDKLAELDGLIDDLKSRPEPVKEVPEAKRKSREIAREIAREVEEVLPPVYEEPSQPFAPKIGDTIAIKTFNMEGQLLAMPSEGVATVMVGSVRVNVPYSDLRPLRGKEASASTVTEGSVKVSTSRVSDVPSEIHLRAQRADEALLNLDKYLDDAVLAGLTTVRVIHGKGTGALKKAVWEYLSNHHAVESFRLGEPSEGGAGATIVELKG